MKYTNSNQWYQEYGKEVMDKNEFSEFEKYLNDRSQNGSHTLDKWENLYDDFLKDSKKSARKSLKEAKNGYYIYTKLDNKYAYCDKSKFTEEGFYLIEDYMLDAIHIFETEKEAQEFIDKHAKRFMVDKDNIIIAEYPSTKHEFFESKKSARKSMKEGLIDIRKQIQDYANANEFDITVQTTPKNELIIAFGGTSDTDKIYNALMKELKSKCVNLSKVDVKKKNDIVIVTWDLNFNKGMSDEIIVEGIIDLIDNLSEVVDLHYVF